MPLTSDQIAALRKAAQERGIDADKLMQAAELVVGGDDPQDDRPAAASAQDRDGLPLNERLLLGHLPYLRVRELRKLFLRLEEDVPDQDLMTGEWLLLHGGAQKPATGDGEQ